MAAALRAEICHAENNLNRIRVLAIVVFFSGEANNSVLCSLRKAFGGYAGVSTLRDSITKGGGKLVDNYVPMVKELPKEIVRQC